MTDLRTKIIQGLENCVPGPTAWCQMREKGQCEFDGPYCISRLHRDAATLLKSLVPRMLDFGEIQTLSRFDVHLEERNSDLVYPLMLLGAENNNKSQTVFFHPMTVKPLNAYGKTWRCWTCRPSRKQREETPWE